MARHHTVIVATGPYAQECILDGAFTREYALLVAEARHEMRPLESVSVFSGKSLGRLVATFGDAPWACNTAPAPEVAR